MRKTLLLLLLCAAGFGHARARQTLPAQPLQPQPAQPAAAAVEDSRKKLRVLFQGGNVADNVAQVLTRLKELDALRVDSGSRFEGMTAAQAYAAKLDLPGASAALNALAEALNRTAYGDRKLGGGERVLYPDVDVDPYEVVKTYDTGVKDDIERLENDRRQWAAFITEERAEKGKVKLKLTVFELKARIEDPLKLNRAIDEIKKIAPAEIMVASRKAEVERPAHVFTVGLEGGDTAKDAGHVLRVLVKLGIVKLGKHTVSEGETVESIYKEALKIPVSLIDLAGELNDTNYRRRDIRPGEVLKVPAAGFERYEWTKTLNLQSVEDKAELQRIREHWNHVTVAETMKSADVIQVGLAGYKLSVDAGSAVKMTLARVALSAISSKNIVLSFPPKQSLPTAAYFARAAEDTPAVTRENQRPDLWWTDCCVDLKPIEEGKQAWMGDYIGLPEVPEIEKICTGKACPQIVLLDELPDLHPDIAAAIIDDGDNEGIAGTLVDKDKKQIIRQGTFIQEKDHGTHLAGIIASQDNDFGLIGINPRARIFPLNWDELRKQDPLVLALKIDARSKRTNPQIWVFASFWELQTKKGEMTTDDERFQDARAKKIEDTRSLWITAAGQGPVARPISHTDTIAPMNLGDLPNVVVVTACEGCYGESPHIERHSNYSANGERMVHVAAPGQAVPSTVMGGKYAMQGGTSQATAFVAGVVSAMMSGYPFPYREAWRVKFRLQVTARPSLTGVEASRVAAGVLDPSLALLDPDNNYLDAGTGKLEPFSPKLWCAKTLDIWNPATDDYESIRTEKVYRVLRTQSNEWVVFYTNDPKSGVVMKAGPGTIKDPDGDSALLLKSDNTTLTLNQVSDMLLALPGVKEFTPGVCPASPK
jgi:subtilisin family serine protease